MTGVIQFALLILLSGFQEVPIEVQLLQADRTEKVLWQGIDAEKLTVLEGSQSKSIPITALKSIAFASRENSNNHASSLLITLADGSSIQPAQVIGNNQSVKVTLPSSQTIDLPAVAISSIRLQELNAKQAAQWRTILDSRIAGDTLVVVRSPEAVDKIEGQIIEINSERVVFDFNKQKVEAPRGKLAGLRFLSPPAKLQRVTAIVTDKSGNIFNATSLGISSSKELELMLAGGSKITLPVLDLLSIDFSIGSQKYVAELQPIAQKQFGGFALKTPIVGTDQLFGPQLVNLPQTSGPSLKMIGSGVVTYRVPAEYTALAGRVFLAPEGDQFTACNVEIRQENDLLWQGQLKHPSDRLDVSAKVQPESRLQFSVTAEGKYPVGDVVVWQELRMLK